MQAMPICLRYGLQLLCALCLAISTIHTVVAEQISIEEQFEAEHAVRMLDEELRLLETLPASERMKKELAMGTKMKRLERKIRGTKANNRLLYILANWQVTYETKAAIATIEQLQSSPYKMHKGTLDLIRIRYYLRTGDTNTARSLVDKITNRIPEFGPVADLVALYEQRGSAAPQMEGNNLSGGDKNPIKNRAEPFLYIQFTTLTNDWQRLHFETVCEELRRDAYAGKFRVICVTFDNKYIEGLRHWNEMSKDQDWELFWANPGPNGDADHWKHNWGVQTLPNSILIGVDRSILDINPNIEDLRTLAGVEGDGPMQKDDGPQKGPRAKRKGPRWR